MPETPASALLGRHVSHDVSVEEDLPGALKVAFWPTSLGSCGIHPSKSIETLQHADGANLF